VSKLTCFGNPIGDIAVDPTSGRLVTTDPRDCTVSILDAEDPAVGAAIPLNGDPLAVVVTGGRAYVATTSASYDAVSVIDLDTQTILSVHPLAFNVTGIAVSPDGARLFVARTGRLGSDVAVVHIASGEITSIPVAVRGASSIDMCFGKKGFRANHDRCTTVVRCNEFLDEPALRRRSRGQRDNRARRHAGASGSGQLTGRIRIKDP
jgi:DNA-binding beta-propeller fold protein YncE